MTEKDAEKKGDDTQQRVQHHADDNAEMWRQKRRATKDYALEPKDD